MRKYGFQRYWSYKSAFENNYAWRVNCSLNVMSKSYVKKRKKEKNLTKHKGLKHLLDFQVFFKIFKRGSEISFLTSAIFPHLFSLHSILYIWCIGCMLSTLEWLKFPRRKMQSILYVFRYYFYCPMNVPNYIFYIENGNWKICRHIPLAWRNCAHIMIYHCISLIASYYFWDFFIILISGHAIYIYVCQFLLLD